MPNTGMIKTKGFKHEIYERKLREGRFVKQNVIINNNNNKLEFPKVANETNSVMMNAANKRTFVEIEETFRSKHQQRNIANGIRNAMLRKAIPDGSKILQKNKLAPFSTLGKSTCGFNFSRETDNKKKNFGILPSNLVKWRTDKLDKINVT